MLNLACVCAAIKHAVTNKIELMEERCSLYEQMGEMSKALMGYTQILNHMEPKPENDDKYLKLARKVCEVTQVSRQQCWCPMRTDKRWLVAVWRVWHDPAALFLSCLWLASYSLRL